MKEIFIEMAEKEFGLKPWMDMIQETSQVVTTETFETVKDGVKTTIICSFNKDGYPVACNYHGEKILTDKDKDLINKKKELEKAVRYKDYRKAADLQEQINKLEST